MMTFVYAFPLLARFNNTVLGTIRNAFIMSVTSLPKTFSMLLLIGACVALTLYTQTTLRYGLFLWFALGFSSIAYANAFVLNDVFHEVLRAVLFSDKSGAVSGCYGEFRRQRVTV